MLSGTTSYLYILYAKKIIFLLPCYVPLFLFVRVLGCNWSGRVSIIPPSPSRSTAPPFRVGHVLRGHLSPQLLTLAANMAKTGLAHLLKKMQININIIKYLQVLRFLQYYTLLVKKLYINTFKKSLQFQLPCESTIRETLVHFNDCHLSYYYLPMYKIIETLKFCNV